MSVTIVPSSGQSLETGPPAVRISCWSHNLCASDRRRGTRVDCRELAFGEEHVDSGSISIDPYFETSRKGIFAVGDVHGDIKLITVAWAEGIQAAIHAFKEGREAVDFLTKPAT